MPALRVTEATRRDPRVVAAGLWGWLVVEALGLEALKRDGTVPRIYATPAYLARVSGIAEVLGADAAESAVAKALERLHGSVLQPASDDGLTFDPEFWRRLTLSPAAERKRRERDSDPRCHARSVTTTPDVTPEAGQRRPLSPHTPQPRKTKNTRNHPPSPAADAAGALSVPCRRPGCQAPVGATCRTRSGKPKADPHACRVEAAAAKAAAAELAAPPRPGGLWGQVLDELRAEHSEHVVRTYFEPLDANRSNGALRLVSPSRPLVEWVRDHYLDELRTRAAKLAGRRVDVLVDVVAKTSRGRREVRR